MMEWNGLELSGGDGLVAPGCNKEEKDEEQGGEEMVTRRRRSSDRISDGEGGLWKE